MCDFLSGVKHGRGIVMVPKSDLSSSS